MCQLVNFEDVNNHKPCKAVRHCDHNMGREMVGEVKSFVICTENKLHLYRPLVRNATNILDVIVLFVYTCTVLHSVSCHVFQTEFVNVSII